MAAKYCFFWSRLSEHRRICYRARRLSCGTPEVTTAHLLDPSAHIRTALLGARFVIAALALVLASPLARAQDWFDSSAVQVSALHLGKGLRFVRADSKRMFAFASYSNTMVVSRDDGRKWEVALAELCAPFLSRQNEDHVWCGGHNGLFETTHGALKWKK